MDYPVNGEAVRQFKLWDTKENGNVPHRSYSVRINAVMGAIKFVLLNKGPHEAVHLYDCTTGEGLFEYVLKFKTSGKLDLLCTDLREVRR